MTEPERYLHLEKIYGHIELSEQQEKWALLEAKIKSYFKEKNKEYWDNLENKKK